MLLAGVFLATFGVYYHIDRQQWAPLARKLLSLQEPFEHKVARLAHIVFLETALLPTSVEPGVRQHNADPFEVLAVARGQDGGVVATDGCDLCIGHADRTT